jgi:glycosyltransferase involved in cell wall biosynthesis
MSEPLFSVVVPCYRQAHYLPEAVGSVIAQTLNDWELIIVDDGSPDDTAAVAEHLIALHPGRSIRLVRQANAGLAAARNAGIAAARGELIMPLDSDDALEPDLLRQAAEVFAARPEVGFVYSDVRLFDGESGVVDNPPFDARRLRVTCLLHAMSPFRRAAWEQAGGYRTTMGRGYEDWDFWLALIEAGWQAHHLEAPLARYRRTGASKLTRDQRYDLEIRALLIRNHPTLYERGFRAWAERVAVTSAGDTLRPGRWWPAFVAYNLLIARHAPRELPRTLLRPLYWKLPARLQNPLRRVVRLLLR